MTDKVLVATGASRKRSDSVDRAGASSTPGAQHSLVIFEVSGQNAAFRIQNVERITPMARVARPPGLPSFLEGILNLSGVAVPVLRLDRLLQLPEHPPGLYSMLIVTKGVVDAPIAMLVDRVVRIAAVTEAALLPVGEQNSFNAYAEASVAMDDKVIHLLSPARILLAKERKALSEFHEMAQRRLQEWHLEER